jgi:hypothetical protein
MRGKRSDARERAAVLSLLEASGQSVAQFCREQRLPYALVSGWRRSAGRKGGAVKWIEVEAVEEQPVAEAGSAAARILEPAVAVELALPGGMVLRIYREVRAC